MRKAFLAFWASRALLLERTTTATTTVPNLPPEVLEALTAKINAIDASVGALQTEVDTSAQRVFQSEVMAQNNRLNITSELHKLYGAGSAVQDNAARLSSVGEEAAVVNSTLLNQA